MAYWLMKTEPGAYSFFDLMREKKTTWNGVKNNLALQHLRAMKKGDDVFIYHSGKDKAIVGIAEIVSNPYPDPGADDIKLVVVDLKPKQPLARPVTLAEMKNHSVFAKFDLLRISRLSIMPVSMERWKIVCDMSNSPAASGSKSRSH